MKVLSDTFEIKSGNIRHILGFLADKYHHYTTYPIKTIISNNEGGKFQLEVDYVDAQFKIKKNGFAFYKRKYILNDKFNIALMIPTGIGCELGGHAGDAGPLAKLLGGLCDTLITHPNVVNASDINEMPSNTYYVEGSAFTNLLMGSIGLLKSRGNNLLVIIDKHNEEITNWSINAVRAAEATYGLKAEIKILDRPISMKATISDSGRAIGNVDQIETLVNMVEKSNYNTVAIASPIDLGDWEKVALEYFKNGGVNPWGGIEANLTHALTILTGKQCAHAPMASSKDSQEYDVGIVDPRMAAECVSVAYLNCVLKGLMNAPLITNSENPHCLSAKDIHCLVIPDGCLSLAVLAALEQEIPVIAVKENKNIMKNNLDILPWIKDKFFYAENYWEAAGIIQSLKSGIDPYSVRRNM